MKKANYILKYLLANKLLRPFCLSLEVDYKYIHGVTNERYNCSMNIQKSLSQIILPNYWYEEADDWFRDSIKSKISSLFISKPLKDI